ncbi:MAG: GntR family transcriptional regulator [Anaerolineales bacterium]|nr:GntR family transcriptional regulator [Anaerolineales bacterium]
MDETSLYQKIIAAVRQEIMEGQLKPGERLPPVREMAARWDCTLGTVQRAYRELAGQGLVISRAGRGTHVVDEPPIADETPLRRANLVHHAERFLLEALTAGYTPDEVEAATRLALDRWRSISQERLPPMQGILRFAGSHDPALAWLAANFPQIVPQFSLQLGFSGSLGGLIALAEGQADLAGCHLWDQETDSYNTPFVQRLLPGRRVALVTLAQRRLGLITAAGNPLGISDFSDLERPLRFVNRQPGSGTRVWLDAALQALQIDPSEIQGYDDERLTHTDVARQVAEGRADVGLGLESAALVFGLDFIYLALETYDLVIPAEMMETACVRQLVEWLDSNEARRAIEALGGYETEWTGKIRWV